jgi:hypothetical protein
VASGQVMEDFVWFFAASAAMPTWADVVGYVVGLLDGIAAYMVARLPFLTWLLDALSYYVTVAFNWAGERLQALGSLAALSFGIYKWWSNRESMLLRRMEALLSEHDRRLADARPDLIAMITTPGPGKKISVPLFERTALSRVLGRRNWLPVLRGSQLPTATDRAIVGAAGRIGKLIETGEKIIKARRQELFTAHLLQGAMTAARAARFTDMKQQGAENNIARRHFEDALEVHGCADDRLARQLLGLQLLKLGELDRAEVEFRRLVALDWTDSTPRQRAVTGARAAYFNALVAIKRNAPGRSQKANYLLIQSINYWTPLAPCTDPREQLELARTHEQHACVRTHMATDNRSQSLAAAEQGYQSLRVILHSLCRWHDPLFWFLPQVRERARGIAALETEATAGLARIRDYAAKKIPCVCGHADPQ